MALAVLMVLESGMGLGCLRIIVWHAHSPLLLTYEPSDASIDECVVNVIDVICLGKCVVLVLLRLAQDHWLIDCPVLLPVD